MTAVSASHQKQPQDAVSQSVLDELSHRQKIKTFNLSAAAVGKFTPGTPKESTMEMTTTTTAGSVAKEVLVKVMSIRKTAVQITCDTDDGRLDTCFIVISA